MKSRALHIHIDRLVLDGLPPSSEKQFIGALESQLEAQLRDLAKPAFEGGSRSRRISRLNAGEMRAGATAEAAANQVTSALRSAIAGKGNVRA